MSMTEIRKLLDSRQVDNVVVALISAALYGEDRQEVAEMIVEHLSATEPAVVNAAILSVGHYARLDGLCDVPRIGPVFQELSQDEQFAGRLGDALDDIEVFTSVKRSDLGL